MKKIFMIAAFAISGLFLTTNVYAADACTAENTTLSSNSLSDCSTITLKRGTTYTGDLTINKDVTIVGNGATIKGTIKITGGTNINISDLTMTGHTYNKNDDPYIEVASTTDKVDLKLSNVTIYTGTKDESSSFTTAGTGVKVSLNVAKGSTVTIENSTIQTKYAVWMQGGDSDLTVRSSKLSGYAAIDLTSNSTLTKNNKVIVDNSTLTGYALGKSEDSSDYGTIVVGNKENVTIDITNGSKITNSFENSKGARSDLILISEVESSTTVKDVTIDVVDSELINTAESATLGAIYNANAKEGSSFKTENTKVEGTLIANAIANEFYVDFVVDGKSNVVLVNKDGKLSSEDIPNVDKAGYTFDGWFDENGKLFDTTKNVTSNLIVNAKFTKIPESSSKADDTENPNTSDSIVSSVIIGVIGLVCLAGCGIYYTRKRFQ